MQRKEQKVLFYAEPPVDGLSFLPCLKARGFQKGTHEEGDESRLGRGRTNWGKICLYGSNRKSHGRMSSGILNTWDHQR
jgi:hypothetical protein